METMLRCMTADFFGFKFIRTEELPMRPYLVSVEIELETAKKLLQHYKDSHDQASLSTKEMIQALEVAIGDDEE